MEMARAALSKLGVVALAYARKGWAVFPVHGVRDGCCTCGKPDCDKPGKHPLTGHGFKEASANVEKISEWWTRWPDANIAYPTGEWVVLDVDGKEGEAALTALEKQHEPLPQTLTAQTGKGRHLYFSLNGTPLRSSAGKLGPRLDIRGHGGYVVLPPSTHASGARYKWELKVQPAPLPEWVAALLAEPERPQTTASIAGEKIHKGNRHAHLLKLAGKLRAAGCDEATIAAALRAENSSKCNPPKLEGEIRELAEDVCRRYDPGSGGRPQPDGASVWAQAAFVGEEEEPFVAAYLEEPVLQAGHITEIAGPRGLGKSNYARWLACKLAGAGKRVLYLDRDNPPRRARQAIRDWGGAGVVKLLARDKVPALLGSDPVWKDFPVSEYDVVIFDSWDSSAEGVGERDSRLPSLAMSHIIDIAHAENGPAVLVLMNTVRDGTHSRGSGIVEDRADAVFELRDITSVSFTGQKPWWEEIPLTAAKDWAARSTRRQQRERYRMSFVASKFKLEGQEPQGFAMEIDFTTWPFCARDVTGQIDAEGTEMCKRKARERAARLDSAAEKLNAEILRRAGANEPPIRKRQDAEPFLVALGLRRREARDLLNARGGTAWMLKPSPADERTIHVLPLVINGEAGHISGLTEAAKTLAIEGAKCGRPHGERAATSDPRDSSQKCGVGEPENVAGLITKEGEF